MARTTDVAILGLTVVAGALLPLQALINGRLGAQLGTPYWAAAAQNVVGVLSMFAVMALLRPAFPSAGHITSVPIWGWIGGALGMVYVFVVLLAAPRLGAAPAMAGVICGQLVSSLLLDNYGVLHERRPIDLGAIAGVVLLLAGAALILRRA